MALATPSFPCWSWLSNRHRSIRCTRCLASALGFCADRISSYKGLGGISFGLRLRGRRCRGGARTNVRFRSASKFHHIAEDDDVFIPIPTDECLFRWLNLAAEKMIDLEWMGDYVRGSQSSSESSAGRSLALMDSCVRARRCMLGQRHLYTLFYGGIR